MVRLFIENKEVELDNTVQVAITSQFEDLSNPTTIINSWSKTVSIPFTTRNNEIFGHIYNPDKVITSYNGEDYLSTSPSQIKKWDGTGTTASDYVNDTLVDGKIVCTYDVEYLQVGLQTQNWQYTQTKNYYSKSGSNTFEFVYNSERCYRFEFSLRDTQSTANNGEVYFASWDLYNRSLIEGETYIAEFKYKTENGNYIVYDFSLTRKVALTGIYFNPLQKLDFRLEWDSTVIMVGYAKMNEVKQVAGNGTYEITLFGQLGKIFQELQKITFDKSTTDTDYLINGSEYVSEYINRDLVYDSWSSSGQYYSDLKKKNDSGYHLTDIIGFAPNNSFSEGFKYDSFQNGPSASGKFTDVLGESFEEDTGISPDTIIPNGMLPREIGEYRSYLQLPFIYWNKLFQVFQAKAEEITGYKFDLDESWFNNSNPYWYNLVYMLKAFNAKKGNTMNNQYTGETDGELEWSKNKGRTPYSTLQELGYNLSVVTEKSPRLSGNSFVIETYDNINITTHVISFYLTGEMNHAHDILFTKDNCFLFNVKFIGSNGYTEIKTIVVYREDTTNTDIINAVSGVTENGGYAFPIAYSNRYGTQLSITGTSSNYGWYVAVSGENLIKINKYKFGDSVTITSTSRWFNNHTVFGAAQGSSTSEFCWLTNAALYLKMELLQDTFNSNAYFTLNDLWNKDYNLFSEILKYCKMYRILINVDEFNKKIIFKPFYRLFENYDVIDWTNKIDKSKDFVITPITFENKYVLFNYEDNKTKMGEEYKTKFGANYGEYRLVTDYNFNGNTKNIFEKVKTSIVNTDNVLSWTNIYDNHKIVYSFPAELYVYNKDKDNKQVDTFGSYYFHNGISFFSTEASLNLRPVCISDDTTFQQANNTYMYSQGAGNLKYLTSYPALDVVRGNNICLFNVPSENYTYINNYSGKNSIYTNLWKTYINERYNIQNKKITCYVDLKPSEYNQFDWNKLVKIGNQLCIVNKIYDYDITSNGVTKVDLITIQDFSGYNSSDYMYDYIIVSPNSLTIPYDYYKEVTVKSNGHWQIHADDWTDFLDVSPTEGESGNTKVMIGSINREGGYTLTFEIYDENLNEITCSTRLPVSVGGNGNMAITPWYNECHVGSSITIQMSATTAWSVYTFNKNGNENRKVLTYPSIGAAGTTNLTVTIPNDSATGVVDVYIKDMYSDLITSYRVNITA